MSPFPADTPIPEQLVTDWREMIAEFGSGDARSLALEFCAAALELSLKARVAGLPAELWGLIAAAIQLDNTAERLAELIRSAETFQERTGHC